MWMQTHIALETGDSSVIERTIEAMRRHLEAGWDAEYGGLFLAVDADGRPMSRGIPGHEAVVAHTEALYATLLAYEISRQEWCLEWYQRIHDYSFSHYPVKPHGEWAQKLDRQGNLITRSSPCRSKIRSSARAIIYCLMSWTPAGK